MTFKVEPRRCNNRVKLTVVNTSLLGEAIAIYPDAEQKRFVPTVLSTLTYVSHMRYRQSVFPLLIYYGDPGPVGFVACSIYNHEAEIFGFLIKSDKQGLGIGTQSIKALLELLPDDITVVKLGVHPDNVRAIKLYEKLDFIKKKEGVLAAFYSEQNYLNEYHLDLST